MTVAVSEQAARASTNSPPDLTRVAVVDRDSVLAVDADGGRLAYTNLVDGKHELYRYDAAAATSTLVTSTTGGTSGAAGDTTAVAINGDGSEIAFVSDATDLDAGGAALVSGTPQAYVAHITADGVTLTRLPLPGGDATGAGEIALSRDGSLVAFGDGSVVQLWRAGTPLTAIDVTPAGASAVTVHHVTVSADGSALAAVVDDGTGTGRLVLTDVSGTSHATLPDPVDPASPAALTGDGGTVLAAPVAADHLLSWAWRSGDAPTSVQSNGHSIAAYPSVSADGHFVADSWKMDDEDGFLVQVGVGGTDHVLASVDDSNYQTPSTGYGTDPVLAESRPQLSADGLTVAFRSNAQLAGQSATAPSGQTVVYLARLHDEQPPTIGGYNANLAVSGLDATSATLDLPDASDDLAVVSLSLTDNGRPVPGAIDPGQSFTVTGLTPGTKHVFTVTASDQSGHASDPQSVAAWTSQATTPGAFTTTRTSSLPSGTSGVDVQVDDAASAPAISGDGRYVAYVGAAISSYDANGDPLDANGNSLTDSTTQASDDQIYLTDTVTGTTTLVTHQVGASTPAASPAPGSLAISGDGRYLAYVAGGTDLATGAPDATPHVYVYDRTSDASTYVATPDQVHPYVPATSLSDDGSRLLVLTRGSGFLAARANVIDWQTGTTWQIDSEDAAYNFFAAAAISGDGTTVALSGSNGDLPFVSIFDVTRRSEVDSFQDRGTTVGLNTDGSLLRLDEPDGPSTMSAEWDAARPGSLTYFGGPELYAAGRDGVHVALQEHDRDTGLDYVDLGALPNGAPARVGTGWAPSLDADGSALAYVDYVDDASGNYHVAVFVARPADSTAPSWPAGASMQASDATTTSLHLSWPAATDDTGVTSYVLTRNGDHLATLSGSVTGYDVTGLSAGTSYTFTVVAKDAVGNASPALTAAATTLDSGITPGSDPLIAKAQPSGVVTLSWDTAGSVGGYRVMRDDGSGLVPIADVAADRTSYTDNGRLAETSYTYRVDVLDGSGTASGWTKPATVTTPALTITKTVASLPYLGSTGLAALGGRVDLQVTGEPARLASARIAYWTHTDPSTPHVPQTVTVTLTEDAAHPGRYSGTWTIPERAGEVTAINGVISDGAAAHDVTAAAAGLPEGVSGALAVTVDAPSTGSLAGSTLVIDRPGFSDWIPVDAAGLVTDAVPPGGGYSIELRSSSFALLAATTGDVDSGLTTSVELAPKFESTLAVTVAKTEGTAGATTVVVKDDSGHQLGRQDIPAGQSTAAFTGLAAGTDVTVTSTLDDRTEPIALQASAQLTLVGGTNTVTVTHDALPTATAAGTVTSASGAAPVDGAGVHLSVVADGRTWSYDTTTNSSGAYQLPSLAGAATITVSKSGYFDTVDRFSLPAGATVTHDATLDPYASLTVHVLPAPGFTAGGVGVTLTGPTPDGYQSIPQGQTDATFTGLRNGATYELTVRVANRDNVLQLIYTQRVPIDSYDQSVTVQETTLPSATLAGTVTADDGSGTPTPAADATVYIRYQPEARLWTVHTDDQGRYTATVLSGAALQVQASYGQGYHADDNPATVTLTEGDTVGHDIAFTRAALTVHVTAPTGITPGGVSVQVFSAGGPFQPQDVPDGQTDATFTNLWWGVAVGVHVHVNDAGKLVLLDYTTTVRLTAAQNDMTVAETSRPPGPGLTSGTVGVSSDGLPILHWQQAAGVATSGCAGGVATTSVVGQVQNGGGDFGNWAYNTYLLAPEAQGSGSYIGTLPPQYPMHGNVDITSSVGCPPQQIMTPTQGPAGTSVRAMGSGLGAATGVRFGSLPGTNFTLLDGGVLQVDAPAGSGTVPVVADTPSGAVPLGEFTYQAGAAASAQAVQPQVSARVARAAGATANTIRPALSVNDILQFLYAHGQQLLSGISAISNLHDAINLAVASLHPTCESGEKALELAISTALNPAIDALVEAITPAAEELMLSLAVETGPIGIALFFLTPIAVSWLVNKLAGALVNAAVEALFSHLGCKDYPKHNTLIDPAGTVLDTNGNLITGATVTILRADTADGPFTPVDPTKPGIEPATNPEVTADDGFFHWDVRAGYYELAATKPGCTAPGDPSNNTAIAGPYPVPPPQVGLVVTLQCPDEAPPPVPTVTALDVSHGPSAGGTQVRITGTGFTPSSTVTFGTASVPATFVSPNALSVTAPAGSGPVDVVVHGAGGASRTSAADRFFFGDPPSVSEVNVPSGPTEGGTTVTVTGSGFTGATMVAFGGVPGTELAVLSDHSLTVTTPEELPGTVPVVVITPAGASTGDAAGEFTFHMQPVQLTVTAAPDAPAYGQDVTLTVHTSPARPYAPITAREDGATLVSGTTAADGTVTLTLAGLHAGRHEVEIAYPGDAFSPPSSTTTTVTVAKAATTLTIAPIGPPPPWRTVQQIVAYLRALAAYLRHPTVTVHLTRADDGSPVAAERVRIDTARGPICSKLTDTDGAVTCDVPARMKILVLRGQVHASYAGSADYLPAEAGDTADLRKSPGVPRR